VPKGEIVAIVGANGAGKSTLIRTIAGIEKPRAGTIVFHGKQIQNQESHLVCNLGIGQVAEGRQVFPSLSVEENLAMGALLPRARAGAKAKLAELAQRLHKGKIRASTVEDYRKHIGTVRKVFGPIRLVDIDVPMLERWKAVRGAKSETLLGWGVPVRLAHRPNGLLGALYAAALAAHSGSASARMSWFATRFASCLNSLNCFRGTVT
jgi:ABC-type dipeptide/oligopeptide/nickel transport system ATPase component